MFYAFFNADFPQPLDFLVQSCELYFKLVPVPDRFLGVDLGHLSLDGQHVSQYVMWLVETLEVFG